MLHLPIKPSTDTHLLPGLHPVWHIHTGLQSKNQYRKIEVTNNGSTMFHPTERTILAGLPIESHQWQLSQDNQITPLHHPIINSCKSDETYPSDVTTWRSQLQNAYPRTVPSTIDPHLPWISDPRLTLDAFKLHWQSGLQHGNFPAPLITQAESAAVDQFIQGCIDKGILEEAPQPAKPILHPTILIPKKEENKLRLAVDFRPTNRMFSPWPYDIADRHHILASIPPRMSHSSVIDIANAFYQIQINDPEMKNFFGIHVRDRFYRFTGLPQGWKNCPAICQSVYKNILGHEALQHCRLYTDDILIFSQDIHGHWKAIHPILARLNAYGVHINWDKAHTAQKAVDYSEINISSQGIRRSKTIFGKLQKFYRSRSELTITVAKSKRATCTIPEIWS